MKIKKCFLKFREIKLSVVSILCMDEKVLDKYIKGEATKAERQQVIEWLDISEENVREMMALHKLHDISLMNQPLVETVAEKKTDNLEEQQGRWRKIGIELLKITAVVLVMVAIRFFYQTGEPGYQTLYVPSGQRAELTLPDGTKVWLNSHTRLIYPLSFDKKRTVELDGEAYFTVVRNEQPFVVKTGGLDVEVLGTEFNVKSYSVSSKKKVDLLKGSVKLSGGVLGNKSFCMVPKESVSIVDGKLTRSRIDDYDYFKWKEGLICFHNESVGSIIKKLELYYDIQFVVHRTDFLNESYSGKFRTKDGIEQVLKILQLEHEFTYVKDSNLNLITIK